MAIAVEEELVFREWAPLTVLFETLPLKTLNGLFSSDLKITCCDAISELIVLGSNQGICYCFDRKLQTLQRLRCENLNSAITCVKVISSVDFMVACGNKDGNIYIFQIPKTPPDNLPENLKPQNKQIERYTVSEMHTGHITALEWSKNGMKLFSGDSTGHVVLTEIDFYMHLCKSVEVVNEAYEVVQISYRQHILLVSTTYRSIICHREDKWKISQVGKQDRKVLGKFGGIIKQNGLRPKDVIMYCSRPGLRIWEADIKGSVQKTLLFKDSLNQNAYTEVPIINPVSADLKRNNKPPSKESSFGKVFELGDKHLVTYNDDVVYVLNVQDLKVIGSVSQVRGVIDVAVNKEEVFILEGGRCLIRIAPYPDPWSETSNQFESTVGVFSLKEITSKFQSGIINASPTKTAIPLKNPNADDTIVEAEEATECPGLDTDNFLTQRSPQSQERLEIYNRIGEQDYDDVILFKHGKRNNKSAKAAADGSSSNSKASDKMTSSACSVASSSSDEAAVNTVQPTLMQMSLVGLLPEVKSPSTLKNDISEKEKILADLLMFDKVKIDLKTLESTDCTNRASTSDKEFVSENIPSFRVDLRPEADQAIVERPRKEKSQLVEKKKQPERKSTKMKVAAINKIPECRKMPAEWKVFQVNVESPRDTGLNLDEWEII